MDDPQKSEIPALMMQLLQQKKTILVEEMMKLIAETSSPLHCPKSRIRRQKRFLKTSTFWEADSQHMPDDKFVRFYRVTKDVFGEILELIYLAIFKKSVVGDTIDPAKKLAVTLRYLAAGDDFLTLSHLFGVGGSSIRVAVRDVTEAIGTSEFYTSMVSSPLPTKSYTASPRISSTSSNFQTASGRWTTPI